MTLTRRKWFRSTIIALCMVSMTLGGCWAFISYGFKLGHKPETLLIICVSWGAYIGYWCAQLRNNWKVDL